MYGRAPRVTFEAKGGTPSTVGPGSYDVCQFNYILSDGYAPFLSLTDRMSTFNTSSERTPGPGEYDPSPINGKIGGGHSLQNRSKRFEEVRSEVPGPGAYNVLPLSRNARSAMKANVGQPEGLGRVMLPAKSLQLVHRTHTPSIPSPGQAFGYEENEESVLCKRQPPPRDTTLGPGYYHPPLDEMNFPKYKGAHFGNMTGRRCDMKKEAGPGPGQYFPEIIPKTHRVNVRRKLAIPRYHELVPQQEDKKGVPGPGQYDIRGQFEKPEESSSSLPRLKRHFLTKAERFSDVIEVSPPVGTYNDPRCALELLKRTTGVKKSPFGSTAVRFPCDHRKRATPGPGSYDVFELGMANESLKRAISGQTRKGGFGSTARRSSMFYKKDSVETPGPGQYKIEKNEEQSYKKQLTAVFKSTTERLASSPLPKLNPGVMNKLLKGTFNATLSNRLRSHCALRMVPGPLTAHKTVNAFVSSSGPPAFPRSKFRSERKSRARPLLFTLTTMDLFQWSCSIRPTRIEASPVPHFHKQHLKYYVKMCD